MEECKHSWKNVQRSTETGANKSFGRIHPQFSAQAALHVPSRNNG